MKRTTDKASGSTSDGSTGGSDTIGGARSNSATSGGAGSGGTGSKRGVFLILAGLVVTGLAAGYSWLRGLPK
jgi:hypothetical protein